MINLTPICTIAATTFREAIRARLLVLVFFLAFSLLITVTLFGMVTIGDQIKVLKDFGLTTVSLATVFYAAISGATLLDKELQRKTIFNILSKAVSRWEFIVGKFIGLWVTTVVLGLIIASLVISTALMLGDSSPLFLMRGVFFILLESMIVCACVLLFSTIVITPSLTGLFTLATFFAGRSSEFLLLFIEKLQLTGLARACAELLYWILPHFAFLNVSDQITFGGDILGYYALYSALYASTYSALALILSCIFFERRNFN